MFFAHKLGCRPSDLADTLHVNSHALGSQFGTVLKEVFENRAKINIKSSNAHNSVAVHRIWLILCG